MRWHQILRRVCVASGCEASICQGPPVANLPLHSLKWAHSPPIWIIHHWAHTELYLVAGKCPVLQDKQEGLLKWEQLWLSRSTSLLPFDNSHLVLLLCAAWFKKKKGKKGLQKIVINATGSQTRKELGFFWGKNNTFSIPIQFIFFMCVFLRPAVSFPSFILLILLLCFCLSSSDFISPHIYRKLDWSVMEPFSFAALSPLLLLLSTRNKRHNLKW